MTSILAHGGTAGLAAEILLLSLPVVGFGLLWWWNRRLGRREAQGPDHRGGRHDQPGGPLGPGQPGGPGEPSGGGSVST